MIPAELHDQREEIVRAFSPAGEAGREAPFRRLRAHGWASAGVRVLRRHSGHLAGQSVLFSRLNVDAARLARRGDDDGARRAALRATQVEAAPEFHHLEVLLSQLTHDDLQAVIGGVIPPVELAREIHAALAVVALLAEAARLDAALPATTDLFVGWVSALRSDSVVVSGSYGEQTALPLWMVGVVHRANIGDAVVLVSEKLDESRAVVEAVPGITVPRQRAGTPEPFHPFGRGDRRKTTITSADAEVLRRQPRALQILVPVTIEGRSK